MDSVTNIKSEHKHAEHDTYFAGLIDGLVIIKFNVPLRCERALRILNAAQGSWFPTSFLVRAFQTIHHQSYNRAQVRRALDLLARAKVIEQKRFGGTLIWRATRKSIDCYKNIRWIRQGEKSP